MKKLTRPHEYAEQMAEKCSFMVEVAIVAENPDLMHSYSILFELYMEDAEKANDQLDLIQLHKNPTSK
jgi:hypothetical protein